MGTTGAVDSITRDYFKNETSKILGLLEETTKRRKQGSDLLDYSSINFSKI
jgi:hypothetical protein